MSTSLLQRLPPNSTMTSLATNHSAVPQTGPNSSQQVQVDGLEVRGSLSPSGVANYLGITFGHIPERFRQARLVELTEQSHGKLLDATQYGPRCPQPIDAPREMRSHLYEGVRPSSTFPVSEFDCLKLNIYTPPSALSEGVSRSLPVFVWIHGGGWTVGDGNTEYDGNYLVEHSIRLGKPFIYVAINYRLGYFGFLSSRELEAEAEKNGETYFANIGLHDQRLALQWINKYIHHFGGDAANITIAGESAGGWSVLAHLLGEVPVCKRGIIMSSPMWRFPDQADSQATFDRLVASTGLSASVPDEQKLAALRKLSIDDLESLLGGAFARPNWDPNWFTGHKSDMRFEDIDSLSPWVEGVVVGAMKHESVLWGIPCKALGARQINTLVTLVFPDSAFAEEITRAYSITDDQDAAIEGLFQLGSDTLFAPFPILLAQKSKTPMSVYRFDQTDIFPQSPFYGYAYHSLDNVHICRLPAVAGPNAPASMRATADALSQACSDFVYGNQPWEPFQSAGKIMVFNGDQSQLTQRKKAPWESIMTTPERANAFKAGWKAMAAVDMTKL